MTMTRPTTLLSAAALAGGLAWLAKLAVIVATDGAAAGTGETVAAVFYLLGVALLVAGSAAVCLKLVAGRHPVVVALGVLLSPILFFVSFVVLETIAKAIVGDAGPYWVNEEAGIGLTAAFWVAVGAGLLRAQRGGSYTARSSTSR